VKKETIITAVVFFSVGFLAGYVYNAARSSNAAQPSFSANANPPQQDSSASRPADANSAPVPNAASSSGLPPGHPPIETATVTELEAEAAKHPRDPKALLELANYLYDQKQFDQAIVWYKKVLEVDPRNVNARTDMATSYLDVGRIEEAIREYRKSLEVDPRHGPTLYNLIIANMEGTHDLAAARAAWDELHKLNPSYPGLDKLKQSLDAARK
jgi:tetratricopeptide (TPR) repeat protein